MVIPVYKREVHHTDDGHPSVNFPIPDTPCNTYLDRFVSNRYMLHQKESRNKKIKDMMASDVGGVIYHGLKHNSHVLKLSKVSADSNARPIHTAYAVLFAAVCFGACTGGDQTSMRMI